MKGRDSGMPEEACWRDFFDVDCLIERLVLCRTSRGDVVEFGSGYGTFTLPLAAKITGTVYAIDIEPALIALVERKCKDQSLVNVVPLQRDFVAQGTTLGAASMVHALLYNILHLEDPVGLLKEASRVLIPGGSVSVLHWRSDIPTPRGPSLDIRPTPAQCKAWAEAAGLVGAEEVDVSACSPYHFGLWAMRP